MPRYMSGPRSRRAHVPPCSARGTFGSLPARTRTAAHTFSASDVSNVIRGPISLPFAEKSLTSKKRRVSSHHFTPYMWRGAVWAPGGAFTCARAVAGVDGPGVTIFRGLRSLFYHFLCMGCLASTSAHITRAAHNTARKCARVHVSDLCVYLVSCVCRNLRARGTVRKLCRHHEQRSREGPVRRAAPSLCNHFPWKIGCREQRGRGSKRGAHAHGQA